MDIVHYSVLQNEVLEYLRPDEPGQLFIDCTLGEGGHSELLAKTFSDLRLVCLDADAGIMEVAKERLSPYKDRIRFFNIWFNRFFREYPLGG